jgi:PilZ domain-containing protein
MESHRVGRGLMENAAQPGSETIIVRIWGMGADGHAFFQNANARNLTSVSAQLTGIDHELKTGDVIGAQFGDKKARFRVLQAVNAGLPVKIKADIELVEGQQCPWKDQIAQVAATPQKASPHTNKRRFVRHRIAFPIEMRDDRGGGVPMQTNASDIGGRGCYVETLVPFPLGTPLQITFWIKDEKMTTGAIVRASDPGVGMGIEFLGMALDDQLRFQAYLDEIDPPRVTGAD